MRMLCKQLLTVGLLVSSLASADAQVTLRVAPHSDLKILDPIWSGYIIRNHGYLIYDTLFAVDEQGEVRPQMVDRYDVSADKLTYTFILRDGLLWHDGAPVTAEDCIASIKRWAVRDIVGQKIMLFVEALEALDAKTFTIKLREPVGLLILALGKPSVLVPFMMPKRVAETDPNTQISDFTGSGPFVFSRSEWRPGHSVVYVKFDRYKPRPEPASGLADGKVAKVDRVEWLWIPDHMQSVNALLAGEVDYVESPPHDLLPVLATDPKVRRVVTNPLGNQYFFRPNHLHKPFDNPKIREALWYAFNQKDFLQAVIGDPEYYKPCKAMFGCGTALASEKGMDGLLESHFQKARDLLKEAGYDGTPVVLLHSTDLFVLNNLAPVAKSLMERAGFKVDMQSMDWQTLLTRVNKKEPPNAGGWNAFLASYVTADIINPAVSRMLNAGCDKAPVPGWPCDQKMEMLRDEFVRETDPAKRREITAAIQVRVTEVTTHIFLGQWYTAVAVRQNVSGMPIAPVPVFWNVEKAASF
jgi:peptide/nickel transport system substrate-binding protein